MPRLSGKEWIFLSLSLIFFSVSAFPWLDLPGPQQDELLFIGFVEPYAHSNARYSWELGEKEIPIMLMSYVGALKALVFQVLFEVFPATVTTIRSFGLVLGLATIGLSFLFLRRHYGRLVAVMATALLATDPSFVHAQRMDFGPVAIMQLLKMSALLLFSIWLSKGKDRYFAGGMFLFGLALWDKANFIWFLIGLTAAVLLVFWREVRERMQPRAMLIGMAAFILGAFPLLFFNIVEGAPSAVETSRFEFKPSKLAGARGTFLGSSFFGLAGGDLLEAAPPPQNIAAPVAARALKMVGKARSTIVWHLLVASCLVLPLTLRTHQRRGIVFALVLSLVTFLSMFFLRDGGGSVHHLVMLYPFPFVFLAASLSALTEKWRVPMLAPAIVAVAVLVNLSVNARYLAVYTHTGGARNFTDAVYRLVPYLAKHREHHYYLLDWGMSNAVALLGQPDNLEWEDLFGVYAQLEAADAGERRVRELADDPSNRFIVRGKNRRAFAYGRQLIEQLVSEGKLERVAQFHERSGEVAFEIFRPTQTGIPPGAGSQPL